MRALPGRLVLLGHPVAHSLSPRIHGAALRAAGIPLEYTALDVVPAELDTVLGRLRQEDAAGNVTVPHKRAVAAACDHVSDVARQAGAVNTFWFEHGALHGDNTDVAGFDAAVGRLTALAGGEWPRRVGLLGTGGAARAVLVACAARGATVDVHGRTRARVQELVGAFAGARAAAGVIAPDVELVVNATTVGMLDDAMPLDPGLVPAGAAVMDLVYRPAETAWTHACRARGHPAADGIEMLLAQAALAFRRFTGVEPDIAAMRASVSPG